MTAKHPIEKWFTGKALTVIQTYALPTLEQARADGYWPKGAARKVVAALNKQAVALKFAKANDRDYNVHRKGGEGLLLDIQDVRGDRSYDAKLRGWGLMHSMMFGSIYLAPASLVLADQLVPFCANDAERTALATARQWAEDFAPISELLKLLDSRKPIPTLVCKTLSPTVLANVGKTMGVELDSIAVPEIVWKWVKRTGKGGLVFEIAVPKIIWPKGTRHNTSRFAKGTAHNVQCHACGHAIKNVYNWVPLLANAAGFITPGPVSLWVGRDCARKLFGCEVTGDAEWMEE